MKAPSVVASMAVASVSLTALLLSGCGRRGARASVEDMPDAGADPAIGNLAPIGEPSARPSVRRDAAPEEIMEHAGTPTPEEDARTPMPPFIPLVPHATPKSKLPCPPGTTSLALDRSVTCRSLHPKNVFAAAEGPELTFHANGKLSGQGQNTAGEKSGHWWFFREDGTLDREADYVDGEEDGLHVEYWPNGTRRLEHVERNGTLDGPAKTWNEQGVLVSWTLYRRGERVRTRLFP